MRDADKLHRINANISIITGGMDQENFGQTFG